MADEAWGRDNLELHCGLCGTGNHALRLSAAVGNPYLGNGTADSTPPRHPIASSYGDISYWSRYWRALYRVGPENADEAEDEEGQWPQLRLSGIGLRPTKRTWGNGNQMTTPTRVPRRPDRGPDPYAHLHHEEAEEEKEEEEEHLVHIRDVRPPPRSRVEADPEGMARAAWGFAFHESCWRLLGQACQPGVKSDGVGGEKGEDGGKEISSSSSLLALSAIDLRSLWRVLNSVPCKSDLPNWGHNHGGLFLRSQVEGGGAGAGHWRRRFVLLERSSVILVPSPYYDPFYVPELRGLLTPVVIEATPDIGGLTITADESREEVGEEEQGLVTRKGNDSLEKSGRESSFTGSPPADQDQDSEERNIGNHVPENASLTKSNDPFANLPFEIRQMLLTYIISPIDVAHTRFASRAMAHSALLSQAFFRSRFWPGRDLDFVFDGFVFGDEQQQYHSITRANVANSGGAVAAAVDWRNLYRQIRRRRRLNKFGLGEKNRMRVWNQTAEPLARALEEVTGLSGLKGTRCTPPPVLDVEGSNTHTFPEEEEEQGDSGGGDGVHDNNEDNSGKSDDHEDAWSTVSTARYRYPERFGEQGRRPRCVEVEWSVDQHLVCVQVSRVDFFGEGYIAGLRFCFADGEKPKEIGYMARRNESWETLQLVQPFPCEGKGDEEKDIDPCALSSPVLLQGFYVITDACGFRALALHAGPHMLSEYLDWAGDPGPPTTPTLIRTPSGRSSVTRVRAAFDRFRLQALSISYC